MTRFSSRTRWDLQPNALAVRREALETAGAPLVDLTESNPTHCGLGYPEAALAEALGQARWTVYRPQPFGDPAARKALVEDLRDQTSRLSPEDLVLTASTSEAYGFCFKLLCDPGDDVLVPAPSYPLFEWLTALDSVEAKRFATWGDDFELDLESLVRAATPRTRAVLWVHPGNPTGRYLRRAEWRALTTLCAERGWALVCDEVFLDYADARARPGDERMGTLAGEDTPALTFVLSGLSKRCGLPQLKIGWLSVWGPKVERDEAYARLELIADSYLSVNGPVQAALPALLPLGTRIREAISKRVSENRARLLAAHPPGAAWNPVRTEGAWSQLLRLPSEADEERLCLALLDAGGAVQPGHFFDFPRGKWLSVSMLPSPERLERGLEKLVEVLDRTEAGLRFD